MSKSSQISRRHTLLGLGALAALPACETIDPAILDGVLGGTTGAGFGLSV